MCPTEDKQAMHQQQIWNERYAASADRPAKPGTWNVVLETLMGRYSARNYLPDPVDDGDLKAIVAAAQSASTSSNLQCCSIVVVRDPERKRRLAEMADNQAHILQAPLLLVFVADLSRLRQLGVRHDLAVDGLDYLDSAVTAFVDAALAAQNAVIAATSLGLGTCFVGAIRNRPTEVARELTLPPEAVATFGVLVGKVDPARKGHVKPRLPMEVVVHHEQYTAADEQTLAEYDDAMRHFNEVKARRSGDWSIKSIERVESPKALTGRDRLREELLARGFMLK